MNDEIDDKDAKPDLVKEMGLLEGQTIIKTPDLHSLLGGLGWTDEE